MPRAIDGPGDWPLVAHPFDIKADEATSNSTSHYLQMGRSWNFANTYFYLLGQHRSVLHDSDLELLKKAVNFSSFMLLYCLHRFHLTNHFRFEHFVQIQANTRFFIMRYIKLRSLTSTSNKQSNTVARKTVNCQAARSMTYPTYAE